MSTRITVICVALSSLVLWAALWNLPSLDVAVPLWLLTDVGVHSLHVIPGVDLFLPLAVGAVVLAGSFIARRPLKLSHVAVGAAAAYVLFAPLLFLPALVLGGHIPWQPFVGPRLVPWLTVRYISCVFVLFSAALLIASRLRRGHA
jgi:hypothetical protein